jgi:hypothetical protein
MLQRKLLAFVSRILIVTMAAAMSTRSAGAGLLRAEAAHERARLVASIERPEVAAQLVARGVDPNDARSRIAALTDAEVVDLSRNIESAPAGGYADPDAVVSAVLLAIALVAFVIAGVAHVVDSMLKGRTPDRPPGTRGEPEEKPGFANWLDLA